MTTFRELEVWQYSIDSEITAKMASISKMLWSLRAHLNVTPPAPSTKYQAPGTK